MRKPVLIEPVAEVIAAGIPRDWYQVALDLFALTKPRVLLMVLVTTLIGYFVALGGPADYLRVAHLLAGTLLAAGGTLALNQYVEREVDALMERTKRRPLPAGRLRPLEALLFASTLTSLGVAYLAVGVGVVAAALTLATTILYILAYTPLKPRTALCMLVGAVPGALPPVIGWVAARGDLGLGAVVLFGILFLWQFPHTLAIAHLYRDDYARAGVRVLPVVDSHGTMSERQIVSSTLGLIAVSLLPTVIGISGIAYFVTACALGLGLLGAGLAHANTPSAASARRVLMASLLYLPLLLAVLAFDKA
jgi:protoheme IX farnesyltransferase